MELRPLALDHGTSRGGRWLRTRRLRLALWIAVIEGVLVVVDVIPGLTALLAAAGVIAFYLFFGREARSPVREASWIAAASQVCVALVPVLVLVIGALALVAVVILAAIALLVLFADRR